MTVDLLLRLSATSLEQTVRATLEGDQVAARRLRRDRSRHRAARAVQDAVHQGAVHPAGGPACLGRVIEELQFLEDLVSLNELLDELAGLVERGGTGWLGVADRRDIELLAHAGSERLLRLADGLDAPAMDAPYRRCGEELFSVLRGLASRAERSGDEARTLYVDLAATVLTASRHAARAA